MGDCMHASPSHGARTVALVGRTGNGKSATGNTILGSKVFDSKTSCSGVTRHSEINHAILHNGQIFNVIDTPGFFNPAADSLSVEKEISNCMILAKDGIHAILVVFSMKTRFSKEEENVIYRLRHLFGDDITNYMIVVFTGIDDLEDGDDRLNDLRGLGPNCPEPLKEILKLCGNRLILFDNKTDDGSKSRQQIDELISVVNNLVSQNNGRSYIAEKVLGLKDYNPKVDLKQVEQKVKLKYDKVTDEIKKIIAEEKKARCEIKQQLDMERNKAKEEATKLQVKLNRIELENIQITRPNPLCNIL